MKLKCETHGRRVLSVPTSNRFLHRTGDMSVCEGMTAALVDNVSGTTRIFTIDVGQNNKLVNIGTDKRHPKSKSDQIDITRYTRPQE